jgi:hypothetical protein
MSKTIAEDDLLAQVVLLWPDHYSHDTLKSRMEGYRTRWALDLRNTAAPEPSQGTMGDNPTNEDGVPSAGAPDQSMPAGKRSMVQPSKYL